MMTSWHMKSWNVVFCIPGPLQGEPAVTIGFPYRWTIMQSFDNSFVVHLNKLINKQYYRCLGVHRNLLVYLWRIMYTYIYMIYIYVKLEFAMSPDCNIADTTFVTKMVTVSIHKIMPAIKQLIHGAVGWGWTRMCLENRISVEAVAK